MARKKQKGLIYIGCAGWSIPKAHADKFSISGTHLARYASVLTAVEINSSFYKPHKPATYRKWADSVPDEFRFAVKVPKEVTHIRKLVAVEDTLDRFLQEATALGDKLGPLLVQLPPSLKFSAKVVKKFFVALRERFDGEVVLEPRHASWFESEAEDVVTDFLVARVAADPAVVEAAASPGGYAGLAYFRMHGSPRIYYSDYSALVLEALAQKLFAAAKSKSVWCIFDNTAAGAATANALSVHAWVKRNRGHALSP
jgi:uncharacterized protein YecE (DUF72 family)